jgi:hypothetical protein
MTTTEEPEPTTERSDSSTAIAIVLPTLFAIILLILLAV